MLCAVHPGHMVCTRSPPDNAAWRGSSPEARGPREGHGPVFHSRIFIFTISNKISFFVLQLLD